MGGVSTAKSLPAANPVREAGELVTREVA